MEVPEMVLVATSDPIQVERMFKSTREKRQKPDCSDAQVLTRGEYIDTLAMVGEIGFLISQVRSADGDSFFSGGGRVIVGVLVVVVGSNSEVHARLDGLVDGIVQSLRLATTQRHVGDGSLVSCRSSRSVLGLGSSELFSSLVSSPQNTANDVSHGTTSIRTQDLDGNQVGSLRNTVLARTNGAGAVGTVTVPVFVDVILRDGLPPGGTMLELDVVNVDASIDDVDVDTFTAGRVVIIESESAEAEFLTVGDTRKTLEDEVVTNHATPMD